MPQPDKIDPPLSAPDNLQANTRIVHGSHLKLGGEIQGVRLPIARSRKRGSGKARNEAKNRYLKTDAHGFARGDQVAVQQLLGGWGVGAQRTAALTG